MPEEGIDPEIVDLIRAVLMGVPGVQGFVVVLDFGPYSRILIDNTDTDQAAEHVHNAGVELRKQIASERPIRVN